MTEPQTIPLAEALEANLARARAAGQNAEQFERARELLRTGRALVTIRNEAGQHMVFRLRKREAWIGRDQRERPGDGYWLDVRQGSDWTPCGIAREDGSISKTRHSTEARPILYAAHLALRALRQSRSTIEERGRIYTLFVEDRCARCGEELTDDLSVEDGVGPHCYREIHGRPRPTRRMRDAAKAEAEAASA